MIFLTGVSVFLSFVSIQGFSAFCAGHLLTSLVGLNDGADENLRWLRLAKDMEHVCLTKKRGSMSDPQLVLHNRNNNTVGEDPNLEAGNLLGTEAQHERRVLRQIRDIQAVARQGVDQERRSQRQKCLACVRNNWLCHLKTGRFPCLNQLHGLWHFLIFSPSAMEYLFWNERFTSKQVKCFDTFSCVMNWTTVLKVNLWLHQHMAQQYRVGELQSLVCKEVVILQLGVFPTKEKMCI